MTKLKVGMISLGCNKNRVDSETALGLLREHGYELTNDPAQADVLMVNTCGFIASAKEESIDAILDMARYKQIGKCRALVVTGCLAQRYEKDLMQEIPEIDLLMGVNQYQQLPDALEKALGGVRKSYCMDDHTYYAHDRVLTTPSYTRTPASARAARTAARSARFRKSAARTAPAPKPTSSAKSKVWLSRA